MVGAAPVTRAGVRDSRKREPSTVVVPYDAPFIAIISPPIQRAIRMRLVLVESPIWKAPQDLAVAGLLTVPRRFRRGQETRAEQ
jgi:hypothetical protein